MTLRLAAVHFTPELGEVATNRERLVALAAEAAADADVVVLPELATTGFCLTPPEAAAWAETADGPTARALADVARAARAVLVVGLAVRAAEGALENAQLVLDADGRLAGRYAKHHLFGTDHGWARPGASPGEVVTTAHGPIGLLICHDLVYPRTVAALAARRPRLLAFSTAWIGDGEPLPRAWSEAALLFEPAPLVIANRGGAERGVAFADPSAILGHRCGGAIGPRGAGPSVVRFSLPRSGGSPC